MLNLHGLLAIAAGFGMIPKLPKKRKPKPIDHDAIDAARVKREKRAERNRRLAGNGDTDNKV